MPRGSLVLSTDICGVRGESCQLVTDESVVPFFCVTSFLRVRLQLTNNTMDYEPINDDSPTQPISIQSNHYWAGFDDAVGECLTAVWFALLALGNGCGECLVGMCQ